MQRFRFRAALAVSAGALALAASAHADVTFFSFGSGAPSQQLITDFSNDTAGAAPSYTPASPAGWGWTGGLILDSSSGLGAEPAISGGAPGTGNFLSTPGGDSTILTIPGAAGFKAIGMYVGSLDTYNTLTFTLKDGSQASYTGSELGVVSGAANGNQTAANTNGVFEFKFAQPVTGIEFQSTQNSFEIASITGAVPEPATWAMMILGVAMIGFAARRRHLGAVLPA